MEYRCIETHVVEMTDDEGEHHFGTMEILENSVWELSEKSSDYEILLENDDGEWLGMRKKDLRTKFVCIT